MNRYKDLLSPSPFVKLGLFKALREKFREGYTFTDLRADILAGMVVALVAIPLGMALAIASDVAPQYGLYTVIVGGFVVALLGGSRFQVTGPTAAFVVILAPIAHHYGFSGLLVAGLMAGIMLVIMGLARMGKLIQFIPHPVVTGFTSGIAVVIATMQFKDFFGLTIAKMPEHFIERVIALAGALPSFSLVEFGIGVFTFALLLLWPKLNKKIPAPLVALTAAAVGVAVLKNLYPDLQIATIGSRFSYDIYGHTGQGIPPILPQWGEPWNYPDINGHTLTLSLKTIKTLFSSAFAIAMLGAIESLLSAVIADGMAQTKHDPDAELVALGIGNILCPFFGGIAATGAIARTATNIRFGARSPLAASFHGLFALIVVVSCASIVSHLPMAALSALLLLVAYNMSEAKHFFHILRVAPRSDVAVLLICFTLTVVFDMVIGVSVGIVLAALLFMNRMASVTSVQLLSPGSSTHNQSLPKGVMLYEIAGPLFFGAAQVAVDAITNVTADVRVVIFNLEKVPAMDITGLVALETTVNRLTASGKLVFLTEVQNQPNSVIKKSKPLNSSPQIKIVSSLDQAIQQASKLGSV